MKRTTIIPTLPQRQPEGEQIAVYSKMRTQFGGYGEVTYDGRTLHMAPMVAVAPNDTHACLVEYLSDLPTDAYKVSWKGATVKQLREESPNPWECMWFVWDYISPDYFTYLILKPNGWEIGRRDPGGTGGQLFVATGDEQWPIIGATVTVDVSRTLDKVLIKGRINGSIVMSWYGTIPFAFTDGTTATHCTTAVYTEDAAVRVDGWVVAS